MNTEITDNKDILGWVLFDDQCRLCRAWARRFGPLLHRHQFELTPLQTAWVKQRLEKCDGDLLSEMRLLTPQGVVYGGAGALIAIAREIWWARPFYWLAQFPFIRAILRNIYARVAQRRNCLNAKCHVETASKGLLSNGLKLLPVIRCCLCQSNSPPKQSRHAFFEMP